MTGSTETAPDAPHRGEVGPPVSADGLSSENRTGGKGAASRRCQLAEQGLCVSSQNIYHFGSVI